MTNDAIKRILSAPAATLAEARRIIDAAKGMLPITKAKPADDDGDEMRWPNFGGKTTSEIQELHAQGVSYLDQLTASARGVPPAPGLAHRPATAAKPAAPAHAKSAPSRETSEQSRARMARIAAESAARTRSAKKKCAMMARRAAATAPAPAAPVRPLASASTGHLAGLVSHPSSPPAAKAAAIAELAMRPQVTIFPDGRTSVSSRGGRVAKAAASRKA